MKASLAYRIATMKPRISSESAQYFLENGKINEPKMWEHVHRERKGVLSCVKINADNVEKYLAGLDKKEFTLQDDVPNFTPPFKRFFVEFNIADLREWKQCGAYVRTLDVSDSPRFLEVYSQYAQAIVLFFWQSSYACPEPMVIGHPMIVVMDKGHKVIGVQSFNTENFSYGWIAVVVGMTCSFMHCKNVARTEHREYSTPQAVKRNNAPPFIKYYVLDINPMKEVLKREGQSESLGLKKALHICRGHFSTYSDEKPLFGKYAGTFWIPDHVRGKAENGVVVKDYNVKLTVEGE